MSEKRNSNRSSATQKKSKTPVQTKLFQYSLSKVKLALDSINDGMKVLKASKLYGIPRNTLRNKLSGVSPESSGKIGPASILGVEVENKLVKWIIGVGKMGFPITKKYLIDTVQKIVLHSKIDTPFINGRQSRKWFEGFLKRNPIISLKQSEYINQARGAITETKTKWWFKETKPLLVENIEILKESNRIFNMDETLKVILF